MKKMIAMLLALVMALSLAACGEKANDGNTDNDTAKTELVLGTSADYAPFEFMYPDDSGEMVYARCAHWARCISPVMCGRRLRNL